MPKTLPATEVKTRFGSVVDWVLENGDEVIVENHGVPSVVVISFQEYESLRQLKEDRRRQQALGRLEQLRERVQSRTPPMTEVEVDEVADQITRRAVESLLEKGEVKFGE